MGDSGLAMCVAVAREGMADEDRIVGGSGQLPPRLEGHRHLGEDATALEHEGTATTDRGEQPITDRVARTPCTGDR